VQLTFLFEKESNGSNKLSWLPQMEIATINLVMLLISARIVLLSAHLRMKKKERIPAQPMFSYKAEITGPKNRNCCPALPR
jgi:hypothetical protein